ncbi:iron chelate uptake ABC transporter family permease subunit [Corynebacterium guangdongense]|uniref:Iron complex transport system permease protein n=1 Tax=Corynebacterium guangdongense TaxID=1783348 RepID=A0ABU1ZV15_9CORY|nr:iron chelate uptake ABC transporter family permease subunit [Corynebacterium guangdongense]MDR7328770.1 iron complex transport system permease protein [Corynebacterium guangdongense]WJZ17346.1 Iron-uptake system permease protein FeuC [Corynebacterium guangdongense]
MTTTIAAQDRHVGAFTTARGRRKYWVLLLSMLALASLSALGLLAYNNPMEFGTPGFWLIAQRRLDSVIAMAVVAICQGMATVAFHTVTNNRIVTPSIMGFESLYRVIHTGTVFFFGAVGLVNANNLGMFVVQILLMVGLSLVLYSWLLTSSTTNIHAMLLIGVVIGGGLGSIATFMQRLLTPSEFDVLTARLFGSVNNADSSYYPIAIPLCLIGAGLLYVNSRRLNVIALGRDTAMNLGVNFKTNAVYTLVLVAVLMAVSTALVGPMTFLGFLVATLAYQFSDTYDHRFIFPMATVIGFVVLTTAYFVMNHIFYAQGVVSILIEIVGGTVFLLVIMRKGRL